MNLENMTCDLSVHSFPYEVESNNLKKTLKLKN